MKKEITIDECICDYLTDERHYIEVGKFLEKVFEKCDKFVIRKPSPLLNKVWKISKASCYWRPSQQKIAKFFMSAFVKNINKVKFLENISSSIDPNCKELPSEDIYIIETALNTQSKLIITTDTKLKASLDNCKDKLGIECYLFEDFIKSYR
jgi:predicted nucleic acid-binding protein